MEKWEYKTVLLQKQTGALGATSWKAEYFTEQLNEYGQQGWELVSQLSTNAKSATAGFSGYTSNIYATFKRKIG